MSSSFTTKTLCFERDYVILSRLSSFSSSEQPQESVLLYSISSTALLSSDDACIKQKVESKNITLRHKK